MALIKVEMSMPPVDGMDIKFKAPCDCTQITGLLVEYPGGSQEFTFRDCHGNNLTGIGNLFGAGAYIKVIVDVGKGYAYLQNADNNGFLNSAVLGTYTHDGETLTGFGENGKFKATTSGAISTINVNGVACSVRCGEESSIDLIAGNWYTFILDGDTVNFSSGGAGGGGLNFRVIGNPPPASPKDNDIWIDTDVPISSYIFSATQPTNPTEGMVWITTGTSSTVEFNALKKNGIQVYPISAKQYVSRKWVDKTAQSYQGGKWVDWIMYLYQDGEFYDISLTGDWYETGWNGNSSGSVTFNDTCIHFATTANSHNIGIVHEEAIDLTDIHTISCAVENMTPSSNANSAVFLMVCSDIPPHVNNWVEYTQENDSALSKMAIDVSSLSGEYYIAICAQGGACMDVTEVTCR